MTKDFVTLFDSVYLPQGLVLYESLMKNLPDSRLWVICMDELADEILRSLNLRALVPLKIAEFETDAMREAKKNRTKGEYCWTVTPFAADIVFSAREEIREVTYLDADLYIINTRIKEIYKEFYQSNKNTLITRHAYSPEYDQSSTSGMFCVQFMTFKRYASRHIREHWQQQCINWCYNRVEDGKFGDQKYLDEWPELYESDVHILQNQSLIMGPWNSRRFPYSDAAIWHFHGLRLATESNARQLKIELRGAYDIPEVTLKNLYANYISHLNTSIAKLTNIGHMPMAQ